ncbi:tol-pal system-associated acyl-CoA thioesterase [uncultured Nevskia sp.]|uniref:tol-pal system-associated acyl-CoA thioesterase n=1 Tax=uncultured Nevskia sp. TaxID=228950 RepID=UPI0025D0CABB|nr:tol-pal system-associated acyl-CoA thioesterase [uncultured Nevskia sp.]
MSTHSSNGASGFSWPLRVYYEDTDVSGVVYHANYLKFFERARTEWLRSLGYSQESLRHEVQVAFTVSRVEVAFWSPARLDDALIATVAVTELKRASLVMTQQLRLGDVDGKLLAEAEVKVVSVDATNFKPCALPDGFRNRVQTVENAAPRNPSSSAA